VVVRPGGLAGRPHEPRAHDPRPLELDVAQVPDLAGPEPHARHHVLAPNAPHRDPPQAGAETALLERPVVADLHAPHQQPVVPAPDLGRRERKQGLGVQHAKAHGRHARQRVGERDDEGDPVLAGVAVRRGEHRRAQHRRHVHRPVLGEDEHAVETRRDRGAPRGFLLVKARDAEGDGAVAVRGRELAGRGLLGGDRREPGERRDPRPPQRGARTPARERLEAHEYERTLALGRRGARGIGRVDRGGLGSGKGDRRAPLRPRDPVRTGSAQRLLAHVRRDGGRRRQGSRAAQHPQRADTGDEEHTGRPRDALRDQGHAPSRDRRRAPAARCRCAGAVRAPDAREREGGRDPCAALPERPVELAPEPLERAHEAHADRRLGNAQTARDLRRREILVVPQRHHRPIGLGQSQHRLAHAALQLDPLDHRVGGGRPLVAATRRSRASRLDASRRCRAIDLRITVANHERSVRSLRGGVTSAAAHAS